MSEDVNISIQLVATDMNGGTDVLSPLVVLCPCENLQECIAENDLDGGETQFVRLMCNCNESKVFGNLQKMQLTPFCPQLCILP